MKKLLVALSAVLAVSTMSIGTTAFAADAQGITKVNSSISETQISTSAKAITGKIPQFKSLKDPVFQAKLNNIVDTFYKNKVASFNSKNLKDGSVSFSYDSFGDDKYQSIVLHASINYGNTGSDDVQTIVMDKNMTKFYTLEDIMGSNAYDLVQKFVNAKIKAEKDLYLENAAPIISTGTSFYIGNNANVTIIFDKYEITPGYAGCPKFEINLNDKTAMNFPIESTYTDNKTVMVPLVDIMQLFKVSGSSLDAQVVLKDGKLYSPLEDLSKAFVFNYAVNDKAIVITKLAVK